MSPAPTPSPRALFLDRDGVINVEINYLHKIDEARFIPGIFDLCRTAQQLGYRLIIVTNQAGIAHGIYTEQQYFQLMDWMRSEFAREGVTFDAVYHSPWHPQAKLPEYRCDSLDRKPAPGMVLRGAAEFSLDLSASVLIGDRCSDVAAANAAGIGHAFLISGTEHAPCDGTYTLIHSLDELRSWLLTQE